MGKPMKNKCLKSRITKQHLKPITSSRVAFKDDAIVSDE
jgi:hypothetical protein